MHVCMFVFPYSIPNEVLKEAAKEMDRVDVLFHKSMYLLIAIIGTY